MSSGGDSGFETPGTPLQGASGTSCPREKRSLDTPSETQIAEVGEVEVGDLHPLNGVWQVRFQSEASGLLPKVKVGGR
jgi:hypothetical protein